MKRKALLLSIFILVLFASSTPTWAIALRYTLTDLGSFGGGRSHASDVNENGQVVGYSEDSGANGHAFIWTRETGMTDLGWLPGGGYASATGVNDAGHAVGFGDQGSGIWPNYAFKWTPNEGMNTLPNASAWQSSAFAINNSEQIVGYRKSTGGERPNHAYLWEADGTYRDLGTYSGAGVYAYSYAYDINDHGQIVGTASWGDYTLVTHAAMWNAAGAVTDLGVLPGGEMSEAYAVNEGGQVVGYSFTQVDGAARAFLLQPGIGMLNLGVLLGYTDSVAHDVNSQTCAVGWSYKTVDQKRVYRASLWNPGGGLIDLNETIDPGLGWTISRANAINERGWIVGSALNSAGQERAVLLTPVPEPSSVAALILGMLGGSVCCIKRRRARALSELVG